VWTVGIDVGGTFTDLYATRIDADDVRTAKVLTTPADCVERVVAAGIAPEDISLLVHGTTTATNALIERDFPNAAMITTEGFRDVIEIGRMHRKHLYRPYQVKPEPLIRRRFRYVTDQRVTVAADFKASGHAMACRHESIARSVNAQSGASSGMGDAALTRGPVR
jgi:N-methylhydantoinase A